MAVDYSTGVRIGMLDAIETAIGAGPVLRFYSGTKPGKCSDASTGTLLASITLTGDFMSGASAAGNVVTKAKNPASTWSGQATTGGVIGYYRIYDSSQTTCHEQGTVTATGGGGDITIDNTTVALNQTITITGKTITAGNAGV